MTVEFRLAKKEDVGTIVEMLANDPLRAARESVPSPLPRSYGDAFAAIHDDPNNELVLATYGASVQLDMVVELRE